MSSLRIFLAPALVCFATACAGSTLAAPRLDLDSALFVPSDIYRPAARVYDVDRESAQKWLERAQAAIDARQVAEALRCAAAALAYDPDDAAARRLLGQRRIEDAWCGGYAARMLEAGRQWHAEYGWTTPEQLAQFSADLRPLGRRWVSIEDDRARHATIANGWSVRTDNFQVVTNHSRLAAAALAVQLESVYLLWLQRFGEFAISPEQLQSCWDGGEVSGYRRQPFRVIYHATRDQYNAALRRHQPQIEQTIGIYFDFLRQSHFFAGPDQDLGAIRHEAVHQFFQESGKTTRRAASTANAWALEGVACYFESLEALPIETSQLSGQAFELGGSEAGRLPAARQRRLVDGYYVPLSELCPLGMVEFQARPDLPRLYSQAAGLATFCCEYNQGGHRDAFRELLRRIYAGRDAAGTLAELAGIGYNDLDREYEEYLRIPGK